MTEALKKILRMRDLVESGRVPNKATGYRWVREGILPKGRKYGPNCRGWTTEELDEHDANLPTEFKPGPPPRGSPRKPKSVDQHEVAE